MSEFFDYNPHKGVWYEADFNEDGSFAIHTRQDVQPVIDYATKIRNSGAGDRKLKEEYFERYAVIPTMVELELRAKGININNPNQTKELLREINQNYPHLKTTFRHHG